jgi:hypothetical protein
VASLFAPDALQQLLAACPSPACESCVWAIAEVGAVTELAAVKGPARDRRGVWRRGPDSFCVWTIV